MLFFQLDQCSYRTNKTNKPSSFNENKIGKKLEIKHNNTPETLLAMIVPYPGSCEKNPVDRRTERKLLNDQIWLRSPFSQSRCSWNIRENGCKHAHGEWSCACARESCARTRAQEGVQKKTDTQQQRNIIDRILALGKLHACSLCADRGSAPRNVYWMSIYLHADTMPAGQVKLCAGKALPFIVNSKPFSGKTRHFRCRCWEPSTGRVTGTVCVAKRKRKH